MSYILFEYPIALLRDRKQPEACVYTDKMEPSQKLQSATESYETDVKEVHEITWSSASSSHTSLDCVHAEGSVDGRDDHTVAFADLEPTASRSIPPPPQSHSECFDPDYEIKWEENDIENPKNWSVWRKTHTIFACTIASCTT